MTTLPAPITHPDTMLTGSIVALDPIKTLLPIKVFFQFFTLPPSFPFLKTLNKASISDINNIKDVVEVDTESRRIATEFITKYRI